MVKKSEEDFTGKSLSPSEVTEMLNSYFRNHTWNDSQNFIIKYLEKNDRLDEAKAMKKIPEHLISPSSGFVAKMLLAGAALSQTYIDYMERVGITEVLQHKEIKVEKPTKISDSIISAVIDYIRGLRL